MNDIIGALFGKVDTLGATAIQAIYTQLATQLQPAFLLGMTIYVAFWGYEMLIGRVGVSAPVFLWRIGRMMLIYTLAFSWGDFQPLIVDVLTKAPDAFGNVVCQAVGGGANCSAGGSSISKGLSDVWTAASEAAGKISAAGGLMGVAMAFLSYIVLLVAGVFVAAAVFLVVLGKIALFVLLGLAPLFIALSLFQITIPLFDGWIRSCAQFAIIPLIVYGILGFYIVLLRTTLDDLNDSIEDLSSALTTIAPFLLMCVIGYFLTYQSLAIAQGIAGGARISAEGRDRKIVGWGKSGAQKTGRGAVAAGKWAYRRITGGSNTAAPAGAESEQATVGPSGPAREKATVLAGLKRNRT